MNEPVVIAPVGELDIYAARSLSGELQEAAGMLGVDLVVDLSGVTFLDSTALGALIRTHQRLQAQGRAMRIIAPPGSFAASVFDLAGVRSALDVRDTG